MTVVEFGRERRRGAGKKGTRMHGAIGGGLDYAGGEGRDSGLDAETAARARALARRVREHREAFAFSQQEFARESGISRATLSKIEQGRIYPSMQVRKKLAKALGVSPQELWNAPADDLAQRDDNRRRAS